MFTWNDLVSKESTLTDTFAYWILVEKKKLSPAKLDIEDFIGWFSFHYDIEEQAYTKSQLKTTGSQNKKFRIISPITLAQKWTPYDLVNTVLDTPIYQSPSTPKHGDFTLAVYDSKFLGNWEPSLNSVHEQHFAYLLRLACSCATNYTGRIYIVGSPGWSYEHHKEEKVFMNPDVVQNLHNFGYLYTERTSMEPYDGGDK